MKIVASNTRYFLPLDERIPDVEDFCETEIEIKNVERGLVIFPYSGEHCSTLIQKKLERMSVAFDVLKEVLIDRFHNGFGIKVVDKFREYPE